VGRINFRIHGYKWSLLRVREGKHKGWLVRPGWNLEFCSSGDLKKLQ
jgi:hypothetical protein